MNGGFENCFKFNNWGINKASKQCNLSVEKIRNE